MRTFAQVDIKAPRKAVWAVISDIENSANHISAIQKLEILENPGDKLVGLKWRETRTMFGKAATEVMWITDAEVNASYSVRAESHGAIYLSRLSVQDHEGGTRLRMEFEGRPVTFGAKIVWGLTGFMAKAAMRKALKKDLEDIKKIVESRE